MENKSSKKIQKREDKFARFCTLISNMGVNEEKNKTNIHSEIGVHVSTAEDLIDLYETAQEGAKILVVRDNKGKIKRIVRLKEDQNDLNFKKELRSDIANIKNFLEELNLKLKK